MKIFFIGQKICIATFMSVADKSFLCGKLVMTVSVKHKSPSETKDYYGAITIIATRQIFYEN